MIVFMLTLINFNLKVHGTQLTELMWAAEHQLLEQSEMGYESELLLGIAASRGIVKIPSDWLVIPIKPQYSLGDGIWFHILAVYPMFYSFPPPISLSFHYNSESESRQMCAFNLRQKLISDEKYGQWLEDDFQKQQ